MKINSIIFCLCAGVCSSAMMEKAFSADRRIYGSHEQANQHRNVGQQMEEVDYIDVDALIKEENARFDMLNRNNAERRDDDHQVIDLTNFMLPDNSDIYRFDLSIQQATNQSMEEVNRNVDERQDVVTEDGVIDFKDILERYNCEEYFSIRDCIMSQIDQGIKKPKPIQIDIDEKVCDQRIKKFAKRYSCINLNHYKELDKYFQFLDQDNGYVKDVNTIHVGYNIQSSRRCKLEEAFFNKMPNGKIVYHRKDKLQVVACAFGKYRIEGDCKRIGQIFASDDNCVAIELPYLLQHIKKEAFAEWRALRNIEIPSTVSLIGVKAFSGCSSLQTIVIPPSVTSLGHNIFYNCSALSRVDIRANITQIPMGMFHLCTSLQSISIPEGVKSIESMAFYCCSSLNELYLPSSLTNIGRDAFYKCENLSCVTAHVNIKNVDFSGNDLIYKNLNALNIMYDGEISVLDKNLISMKFGRFDIDKINFIKRGN